MTAVDLASYDLILVNSSGGKDSQAMLTHLVELADTQGVSRNRLMVVHAGLGRVEWAGTLSLAQRQAEAYGLRFEAVSRTRDLLQQVEDRRDSLDEAMRVLLREAAELHQAGWPALAALAQGDALARWDTPAWPSSTARYCTSDQKTSQVVKLMTAEVAARRERGAADPMRILNCLGIRAQESPARAKKQALGVDPASNGRREVTRWLPIFDWSEDEVWATIHRSGLPYHPAYDAGMPRLSCVFCVLAGERELVLAARLNPGLAQEYLGAEQRVRHTFKAGLSMARIVEMAAS